MNLEKLFPALARRSKEPDLPQSVGTPENPLYISAERGFAKTGRRAQQSVTDRVRYLQRKGELEDNKDVFLPADARRQRRAKQAETRRRVKKATRRWQRAQIAARINGTGQ